MKSLLYLFTSLFIISSVSCVSYNKLSKKEKSEGWNLLFDGKTSMGWRGAYQAEFPFNGWQIDKGRLKGVLIGGLESGDAGDIVTIKKYRNFILDFDWKLGEKGNSGVKYFVEERLPKPDGSQPGYEYQLIDDKGYIFNGEKLSAKFKTASLYDVLAADKGDMEAGVWHNSRIVVQSDHIEHWLDKKNVLEINRKSPEFISGVQSGKFKNYKGFSSIEEGHILLQDHGHNVEFRNIKIKEL